MLYQHYKGGVYRVLSFGALNADDHTVYVAYQSEKDGQVWVRDYDSFFEYLDGVELAPGGDKYTGPRFKSYQPATKSPFKDNPFAGGTINC